MCLTAFIYGLLTKTQKNGYRFILAFNRDEFYSRPAKPAAFWPDNNNVIGGLDMTPGKEGGTWLAMSKTGKLAFLLNIRRPDGIVDPNAKGRGSLVKDFVEGSKGCEEYLKDIAKEGDLYNGFNLVAADLAKEEMFYYSNKSGKPPERLEPGSYGVSNALLNAPWTKSIHAKDGLSTIIANNAEGTLKEALTQEILKLMQNDVPFSKDEPIDESTLTPDALYSVLPELVCVKSPIYGTRSQTVILIDGNGEVLYTERYLKEPVDFRNRQWESISETFDLIENDSNDTSSL